MRKVILLLFITFLCWINYSYWYNNNDIKKLEKNLYILENEYNLTSSKENKDKINNEIFHSTLNLLEKNEN